MEDLIDDYSGDFRPNLDHDQFTREGLLKLVKCYQACYLIILGEYGRTLRERLTPQEAVDWDISMWMAAGPRLAETVCEFMNIEPHSVESYLKRRQLDPGMQLGSIDMDWKLIDEDNAFMRINTNPDYMMGHQGEARLQLVRMLECSTAQACAFFHDRDIVFEATKLPPAKNDQEPCFVMEVKRVPDSENPYPHWTGKHVQPGVPRDPAEYRRPWSEEQVKTIWEKLGKELRDVLRELANKPEAYEETDLVAATGLSVERITFQLNFVPIAVFESPWPNKQAPVRLRSGPMRHELDENWANALKSGADWVENPASA